MSRHFLLVGVTVRALAQAAARAGHAPCAIDGFADRDTLAACQGRALRLPMCGARPDWSRLDDAIREMRRRHAQHGFAGSVAGSGLEGRPELLDLLAGHAPPANAGKDAVRTAVTPARWFALLDAIGAAHPKVSLGATPTAPDWLVKRAGGTGGLHVRPWHPGAAREPGDYFQQRAPGRPASALFLAAHGEARIVGWQRQLVAPTAALPCRYGGVVRDDALPGAAKAAITAVIEKLVRHLPLRGLAGLDFLVDGAAVQVLELNPRPTASIALYPALDLFTLHLDACAGRLPDVPPRPGGPRGEAVLYAARQLAVPADFCWPPDCADLPQGAAAFAPGEPVCSVRAAAASTQKLLAKLDRRAAALFAQLDHAHDTEPQCAGRAAGRLAVC